MKLELNKKHKKANLSNLKNINAKRKIIAPLIGTMIAASVFSGFLSLENTYAEEYNSSYSTEYEIDDLTEIIPNCYHSNICAQCNKSDINSVTYDDLNNIKSLTLEINESESLEFLKNCNNLNELCLNFCNTNDEYCLDTIPAIPTLSKITINADEDLEISEKVNNKFIKNNIDNITYLDLEGVSVGPNIVETITNLDTLKLGESINNDINFVNLNINNLDITWYGPYDIPLFLNRQGYETLKSKGTNISFCTESNESLYNEILDEIDRIIDECGISSTDTDQEKIDKLLVYCINNLVYDKEVLNKLDNDEDTTELVKNNNFYHLGYLYSYFEKDTSICGTFAAVLKSVLKRLEIDNYFLLSDTHAWNLVEVEGDSYYVDPTALDLDYEYISDIEEIKGSEWYMKNVDENSAYEIDEEHSPILFPKYLGENKTVETTPVTETKPVQKIDEKEYDLKINGKNYRVPAAVLIGLFTALGLAKKRRKKKKKQMKTRKVVKGKQNIKSVNNKKTPIKGYEKYEYYYPFNPKEYRNNKR